MVILNIQGNLACKTLSYMAMIFVLMVGLAPQISYADANSDWQARSSGPGVVRAIRFDSYAEYANNLHEDINNDKRNNAYDTNIKASGGGSLRFDIKSQTPQGSAGNWVLNFSEDYSVQFGENEEFWIQWRQRFDPFVIEHNYANTSGSGEWKQIIIAQGDTDAYLGYACGENQIVVQNQGNRDYPSSYIECGAYDNFEKFLGGTVLTRQNERNNNNGTTACQWWPMGGDESGCLKYYPNEWMTFMVHVKLGPVGTAKSSVSSASSKTGFINSTFELYVAREGQPLQLAHKQENLVIPRGQHWNQDVGIDPDLKGDRGYANGWGPGDAHPNAKYGKLWLTPFNTKKDGSEVHQDASIWYDEIIVSRSRIPDPGGVSITADPSTVPPNGDTILSWSSSSNPTSCAASGDWDGPQTSSGFLTISNLTKTSTFVLTCDGSSGTVSGSVTVAVTSESAKGGTSQTSATANATGGGGAINLYTLLFLCVVMIGLRLGSKTSDILSHFDV